ncbi:MAG: TonB-dependent receptor [bacterium]|nr:TonB-dependent receptor [bacterium]
MRFLFSFWTLAIIAMIFTQAASASPISGKVVDAEGNAIPSASIVTNVRAVGTQTDNNGQYQLDATDEVKRVTFSSVGFHSRQFEAGDIPETIVLESRYYRGSDVLVRADRAQTGVSAIAFSNLSGDDIKRDYTVGEFPLLLETTPNLYSFSDGGAPLGYVYTTIRGFDDKRIATYINGVPLNDPEDQATYFVDLPDFASNVDDIQVQRGVGNSLYGDASFGGSVNVVTSAFARERKTVITAGYGEYTSGGTSVSDVYKQSIEYASGLIDGSWNFGGRFSRQKTGGYRHHSWYEGWSYFFSMAKIDPRMTTELYIYGGPIKMHLAYWGSARSDITANRRHNPLGYSNETDNFNQPHYHLHNVYRINDRTTLSNTLYYIRGKGYYEQLKEGQELDQYGIDPAQVEIDTATGLPYEEGNLVRQQWVKKNQYGLNPRLDIEHDRGRHTLGGSFYYFESNHYGQVVWAQHISGSLDPQYKYYQYFGDKWLASVFAQEHYRLTERLSTQVTAQFRFQKYRFDQEKMGAFLGHQYDLDWFFFSPRVGFSYQVNESVDLFTNFAISSRTPTDASIYDANDPELLPSLEILSTNSDSTEYVFGDPLAENERVYDFEFGGAYRAPRMAFEVNLFWMEFRNEIIPEGGINENTGLKITTNADRSVHAGVELAGSVKPIPSLTVDGNFSYNYNRVKEYVADIDGFPVDYADKKISGFPDYLSNLVTDYQAGGWRFTNRVRFVGRRYMELLNVEELSLDPYIVSSLSVEYAFENFLQLGRLRLQARVDNLGDKKYESSGYGGDFAYHDGEKVVVDGWAQYFVAAERSFYGQLVLELF